jgi:antitoxin HicB
MMVYYVKLKRQKKGYLAEFPDLPGCLSEGKSEKDALENAKEALDGYLAAHCDRQMNIPAPRTRKGKRLYPIEVGLRVEFVIQLRTLRKRKGMSQAEIAKKLGITQQAYAKLEMPDRTNPSLSTLQRLSEALDADVELALVA